VHASLISGGEERSSYPASCTLSLERRTLPGETAADVEAEVAELLDGVDATSEIVLVREPFEVDPAEPIVELVREAAGAAEVGGVSYWADSAFIAAAGIPTVLYGPAGEGAHADVEWVSVDSTVEVARTLIDVGTRFCA
jgi:acetylornithine deacetylase